MANQSVLYAYLKVGRCSSTVEVRLLRFFEARTFKRGGKFMGVDMIFVVAKVFHS